MFRVLQPTVASGGLLCLMLLMHARAGRPWGAAALPRPESGVDAFSDKAGSPALPAGSGACTDGRVRVGVGGPPRFVS